MTTRKCDHPNCVKQLAVESVENCPVHNCEAHQPYPRYGQKYFCSPEHKWFFIESEARDHARCEA